MLRARILRVGSSLAVTLLISLTVLPLAIPPFRGFTGEEVAEVLLWQVIGTVGWPLAILGAMLSLPFGGAASGVGPIAITLAYPAILLMLILCLVADTARVWPIIALSLLVLASFAAVWFSVLNGYTFMPG